MVAANRSEPTRRVRYLATVLGVGFGSAGDRIAMIEIDAGRPEGPDGPGGQHRRPGRGGLARAPAHRWQTGHPGQYLPPHSDPGPGPAQGDAKKWGALRPPSGHGRRHRTTSNATPSKAARARSAGPCADCKPITPTVASVATTAPSPPPATAWP